MEMEPKEKSAEGSVADDEADEWQTMGFVSRTGYVFRSITVEPILALFQVSSVLSGLTTQNLNLQKACRVNLRLDDEVCWALENKNVTFYADQEVQVQQLVSDMLIWQTIIQSSIPCVLVVLIGSWSDRHGRRKPCMLVPIVGELLRNVGLLLCVYYFYELQMEVAGLVESVPTSLFGGVDVLYMAAFSYIGDISSVKNRTVRVGFMNIFFGTSWPVGAALSGVLFQKFGFFGVYYISTSLYMLAFFYGLIRIKETPGGRTKREERRQNVEPNSCTAVFNDFFNIGHIKEAFHVTFTKNLRKNRVRLYILLFTIIVVQGPTQGEFSVVYMYARLRFNWNEVDYSIFSTFLFMTNIFGVALAIGVLSHVFKIDDAIIGIIACASKVLSGFVFAFAPTKEVFYFGVLVDTMSSNSYIVVRSVISKIVPQAELGQVSAIVAVIETLVPVVYKPMYSAIYRATVDTFPGMFYVVGSVMLVPSVFFYWWIYRINKEEKKETRTTDNDKSKTDLQTAGGS